MSKYNNIKTIVDGITFDSIKESVRYRQLKALEQVGKITDLQCQTKFPYVGRSGKKLFTYKADFTYYDEFNNYRVEDVKGMRLPIFNLKKKLLEDQYGEHKPFEIEIV